MQRSSRTDQTDAIYYDVLCVPMVDMAIIIVSDPMSCSEVITVNSAVFYDLGSSVHVCRGTCNRFVNWFGRQTPILNHVPDAKFFKQ